MSDPGGPLKSEGTMITGEFKLLKQGDPARQKLRFLFMTPNPLQVKYKRQTSQSQTVHSIYKREKELDKGHFSPRAAYQCWLSSTPTPPNKLSGTGDWPSSGLFTSLISRGKPPYNVLLPPIFPGITIFPANWLFTSGGQNIGTSASASVLPTNI